MSKPFLIAALVAASSPSFSFAQGSASPLSANAAIVSDYRFRGISQTFGKPAVQAGADYSHASGLYAGNWNSSISESAGYPNGNLEMDFYGGWKKKLGSFSVDLGAIYYYYPGSTVGGNGNVAITNLESASQGRTDATATGGGAVSNKELYVGGSWRWLSLKYYYAIDDYFSIPDTKHTWYVDLAANFDLGGGWSVNGHVGRIYVMNYDSANYTDYRIGVAKDISGWILGAALVGTDAAGDCGAAATSQQPYCQSRPAGGGVETYDAGKMTVVLSVGRTF